MNAKIAVVLSFVAFFESSGCQTTQTVAYGVSEFTHDFMKSQNYSQQNVVYSPVSIALGLGMLLQGARGQTADQIFGALHIKPGTPLDQIHQEFKQILADEQSGKRNNLTLEYANAVALQRGYNYEKSYPEFLKTYYDAYYKEANFEKQAPKVTEEINQFVESKTHGLVKKIFKEPLASTVKFVIANTIYFSGVYESQFLEKGTTKKVFYNADKSESQVDTMYQNSNFYSVANDNFTLIELRYNGDVSLYVILPKERYGLPSVVSDLTASKFDSYVAALKEHKYQLYYPKYDYHYEPDLEASLNALGVKALFDPQSADLTGISKDHQLYINKAAHKANISFKEGGTEAVAATGFSGANRVGVANGPAIEELHVDHPFAYFIRDRLHNVNLFAGVVNKL